MSRSRSGPRPGPVAGLPWPRGACRVSGLGLLQNGDDVKTVQGNLGHATAAFTLDVYGHFSERMKEDSAARMEAYIKGL